MFNRRTRRRGFSLIELLIVIAIILIIITIAVPKYNNTQKFMRETAAVKAIQTIHQMQVQYQSQYGRFATSLTELGPPTGGAASAASADLIGRDLSEGTKQGHRFTLTGNQGAYAITVVPVNCGADGNKTFYSDQSMVIRETTCPEAATAASKEMR